MLASLFVNGAPTGVPDDDTESVSLELGGVPSLECRHCGEDLEEYPDGWHGPDSGRECFNTPCPDWFNGRPLHEPQPVALAWCNHAAIRTNQAEDSVTVSISVGDPRGGFCFTVRRMPPGAGPLAGRLLLHVPYPGEPLAHVPLTAHAQGCYLVGGY